MATYGTFVDSVPLQAAELNTFLKWSEWSAVVTQSVTLTVTGGWSRYAVVNKSVFVVGHFVFSTSTSGTASNPIEVNLPLAAVSSSIRAVGGGYYSDGTSNIIRLVPVLSSTTKLQFLADDGTSLTNRLGVNPAITAGSSPADALSFNIMYEAA